MFTSVGNVRPLVDDELEVIDLDQVDAEIVNLGQARANSQQVDELLKFLKSQFDMKSRIGFRDAVEWLSFREPMLGDNVFGRVRSVLAAMEGDYERRETRTEVPVNAPGVSVEVPVDAPIEQRHTGWFGGQPIVDSTGREIVPVDDSMPAPVRRRTRAPSYLEFMGGNWAPRDEL